MKAQAAVKRAVGFAPQFDFYAEVTVDTGKGKVTAREGSYTPQGAQTRAEMTAKQRAMFAGFRRAVGYAADALVPEANHVAQMKVGFA